MQFIEIEIDSNIPNGNCVLLAPLPFGHWGQQSRLGETKGLGARYEVKALNSEQRAVVWHPGDDGPIELRYDVNEGDHPVASHVWQVQENRFTRADVSLIDLAVEITADCKNESEKVFALIEYAAEMFGYDHPEERFNEGMESVPAVCGTTKGSCVDINTFLLAAARSLSIKGQYIAGYWFHPEKTETLDMHCWLAFEADGERVFWDLAHHLKWGVPELAPGLNPAGGRRVAMSCGRGLTFETPNGIVEVSHFSEPIWILPDGRQHRPNLRIKVAD